MKIATLKNAYTSLIIGHRGYGYEANLQEIMCWEFSDVVIFDLANGGDDFAIGGNDFVSCENELISGEEFSKWWERVSKGWERVSKEWV